MARRRLGVALLVPPPAGTEIEGLRRALGDATLSRVPAHLTLVPPVNVRLDRLDEALAVVAGAAARSAPLTLVLGPPATFVPDTPVAYLAVGGPGVQGLHRLRRDVFVPPLERPLTWPFVPHVTLLEAEAPSVVETAAAVLAGFSAQVTFERVHVLAEEPGRVWRPVAEMALTAPAVVGRGGLEVELTTTEGMDDAVGAWVAGLGSGPARPLTVTARMDGAVAGVAEGSTAGPRADLRRVVVDPAERRRGVGRHLLARFLAEAAGRGAEQAAAVVASGTAGETWLRARGWSPVAAVAGGLVLVRRLERPGSGPGRSG